MERNVWYIIAALIILIVGAIAFMYRPHAGPGPGAPSLSQVPSKPLSGSSEGNSAGTGGTALPALPGKAPAAPAAPADGTSQ